MGAGAALAGSFRVSPLRVVLSAQKSVVVITIHNDGEAASVMQIQLRSWAQELGQDAFLPTPDVLVTPPIFTVKAGGAQIVRVGLRRAPDDRRELAYRLFLTEVPDASEKGMVKMAMRFSIPVFVAPSAKSPSKAALDWRAVPAANQTLRLEALNQGDQHVQVVGLALVRAADGATVAEYKGMDYLLPAQGHAWTLKPNQAQPAGTRLKIVARTDAGELHAEVALAP